MKTDKAAMQFAREESKRADAAEHWSSIARRELDQTVTLRADIYAALRQEGYHEGSYNELMLPNSTKAAVNGSKYDAPMYHIKQAVLHLIQRARKAEAALAKAREDQP